MILNKGALDGARLLQAETVESMWQNQLPDSAPDIVMQGLKRPGVGFGLGFSTVYAETSACRPCQLVNLAGVELFDSLLPLLVPSSAEGREVELLSTGDGATLRLLEIEPPPQSFNVRPSRKRDGAFINCPKQVFGHWESNYQLRRSLPLIDPPLNPPTCPPLDPPTLPPREPPCR